MFKKLLLTLCLLGLMPVFAGELEDALAKNKAVFLYLYTPDCGYCTRFTPRYNKLAKMYDKKYTFVKLDASTMYGYKTFIKYGGRYVPYVLLIKPNNKVKQVDTDCLAVNVCTEQALMNFAK